MKKLWALGWLALWVVVATIVSAQAAPRGTFYLEKVCPSIARPDLNACDLVAAEPFGQLVGGAIIYNELVNRPNAADNYLMPGFD